jgi:PKD repeat protein
MATYFHFNKKGVIIGLVIIGLIVAGAYILLFTRDASFSPGVNLTYELGSSSINISHQGGEPLIREELKIFLDGDQVPQKSIFLLNNEEWPFSIGETLIVPYTPSDHPRILTILYKGSGSRDEILSATIPGKAGEADMLPAHTTAPTTPPATSPTPTAVPTPVYTPGIPEARFGVSPRIGPVPLTVQFTDQSTGVPESWNWTFGDGAVSTDRDPRHTYMETGTFSVSLQVENSYGAHTRIVQECINVTPARPQDVTISAETEGFIRPDGFAQFSITGPGSRIKIGGRFVRPEPGDEIRLVVKGDGKGSISISDHQISDFSFENVELYLNEEPAGSGALQEIYIPSYADLLTTLVLEIPPSTGEVRITTGGETAIIQGTKNPVVLIHLIDDDSGRLVLDTKTPYQLTYRGAAGVLIY